MSAAGAARNFSGPGAGAVGKLAATLFGAGAIAYGGYNSLFTCPGGHRAVMYNRVVGVKDAVYPEGMHFMIPWFETPTIFDVRTKPKKISSPTGTRDMQMVNISLRVLYKPDISQLPTIFRRFGSDYDDRILPSIVNETLKAVIAQYNASQLITKREQISREIRNHLQERAKDFYILLDDVSITHLSFGSEYTAAVESKQVAQQEAERAKFIVERALQDKRSNIIHAEGEAQSAEMIGKALARNPGFVELRRMEAAKKISGALSSSPNKVYLNAEGLLLNLGMPANEAQHHITGAQVMMAKSPSSATGATPTDV
ncbi:Prohibitin [Plasmodiophora brassicae]|uniref:Prohibitin n=1 Tax=Plasmodiophora brassicae TaxID=37360 RepID=A0A0G4II89_PLABS|nr:hypothetical protein PBRA_003603 [Plasmodiophora brassicae]SPQ98759.1 unnamed protein product [Plasmodiophora brassicae]